MKQMLIWSNGLKQIVIKDTCAEIYFKKTKSLEKISIQKEFPGLGLPQWHNTNLNWWSSYYFEFQLKVNYPNLTNVLSRDTKTVLN